MSFAWIHLKNLKFFLFLGATEAEQLIGQNITLHLSLQIPYRNTEDKLTKTLDYGEVYACVCEKISSLKRVQLLEYLVEQILDEIEKKYPRIRSARIIVEKDYVPIAHFTGNTSIEAEKLFRF